jgi:CubicO group peptidase (beta-lactamase class C family)
MTFIRLAAALLLISSCAAQEIPSAAPSEVGLSAEKLDRIGPAVQKMIDRDQMAGAQVVVARHGKVAYFQSFGKANVESGAPIKPDTIFRIYSMTKSITSVAVMMLVDDGRVKLDDPISKHIPELAGLKVYAGGKEPDWKLVEAKREITVRDLLRHSAGLTYGFFGATSVDAAYRDRGVLAPDHDLAEMIRRLAKIPLLYQPGTQFNYSVSVDVLGRLVEVVSGKSLDAFFQERIFGPLEMKDTGFWVPAEKTDRLATNYGPGAGGKLRVVDDPKTSTYRSKPALLSGGGGLASTARDYLRFCQMMLSGGELGGRRILKRETVAQMTVNQLPPEATPIQMGLLKMQGVGFGLGFSVRVAAGAGGVEGEYGWGGAASTHFWISPKHDLVVVALEQYMPFTPRLADAVKPIVYEAVEK